MIPICMCVVLVGDSHYWIDSLAVVVPMMIICRCDSCGSDSHFMLMWFRGLPMTGSKALLVVPMMIMLRCDSLWFR